MSQYFVLHCLFTATRAQSFPIFPALILEMQLGNKVYSQKRKKQKYARPERWTSAGDNLVDRGPPCQTLRRAVLSRFLFGRFMWSQERTRIRDRSCYYLKCCEYFVICESCICCKFADFEVLVTEKNNKYLVFEMLSIL